MPDLTFDFTWYKHARGYRLIPAKPLPLRRGQSILDVQIEDFQPARIVPNGGPLQRYRPLDEFENLFEHFIRKAKSDGGVLEFINAFGPLTNDGLRRGGEVVPRMIEVAEQMAKADRIVAMPLHKLNMSIVKDNGRMGLKISPACLLDALWLQLAQASGSGSFRECANCHRPFVAGVRGNRRADARFCSDKCRIEFNSLQRSRKGR
jgi:hypothetical protein